MLRCVFDVLPHPPGLEISTIYVSKSTSHVVNDIMPSQAITDLHLEDLPGIKPLEISKLKRIGVESVLETGDVDTKDLTEDTGDKIESMSILIVQARKALANIGLLSKEFCTARRHHDKTKSDNAL